jgi:hypothetical protein
LLSFRAGDTVGRVIDEPEFRARPICRDTTPPERADESPEAGER